MKIGVEIKKVDDSYRIVSKDFLSKIETFLLNNSFDEDFINTILLQLQNLQFLIPRCNYKQAFVDLDINSLKSVDQVPGLARTNWVDGVQTLACISLTPKPLTVGKVNLVDRVEIGGSFSAIIETGNIGFLRTCMYRGSVILQLYFYREAAQYSGFCA